MAEQKKLSDATDLELAEAIASAYENRSHLMSQLGQIEGYLKELRAEMTRRKITASPETPDTPTAATTTDAD